jgi:hypothetical protein
MYEQIYYSAWWTKIGTAEECIRDDNDSDTVYDEDGDPVMIKSLKETVRLNNEKTNS